MNKINSCDYIKGQFIPSEQELSREYGISRVTVRQATNNLAAKGYHVRNQGSGTYVARPPLIGRSTNVKSFTEEMEALGKIVSSKIFVFEITPATDNISKKLNIDVDEPFIILTVEANRWGADDA